MFLQLDGTFWVQLVNFAIFFAILRVVFLRPVGAAIRKRREHIDSVTGDLRRHTGEARDLRARAEAKRALARREAQEAVIAARAAAGDEAAKLSTEAGAKAAALIAEAQASVGAEMLKAQASEQALSEALAAQLLERATETAVTR